jgi:hypothetical protein
MSPACHWQVCRMHYEQDIIVWTCILWQRLAYTLNRSSYWGLEPLGKLFQHSLRNVTYHYLACTQQDRHPTTYVNLYSSCCTRAREWPGVISQGFSSRCQSFHLTGCKGMKRNHVSYVARRGRIHPPFKATIFSYAKFNVHWHCVYSITAFRTDRTDKGNTLA